MTTAVRVAITTEELPNTDPTQAGKPARAPETAVMPWPKATDSPTMDMLR